MRVPTLTTTAGAPIADNQNSLTAGPRGPLLLQDYQLIEKLAHQNRERIPERVVHAKGWGAFGKFTVTADVTRYTRAKIFAKAGSETQLVARFSTVAGELGAADAERDVRADRDVGLLVAVAREPAPGHDSVLGSWPAAKRALHERLRVPHVQLHQPIGRACRQSGGAALAAPVP